MGNASEYISTPDAIYPRECTAVSASRPETCRVSRSISRLLPRYLGARNPRIRKIDIRPIATDMSDATVMTQPRAESRALVITLPYAYDFAVKYRAQVGSIPHTAEIDGAKLPNLLSHVKFDYETCTRVTIT